MTAFFQSYLGTGFGWFAANLILILLIALPLMLAVAMIIYADRKIWAAMALRRGPNVVGPFGLLQSFADGLKVFLKETIVPSAANQGLFLLAPILTFTVALIAWAVIPFGPGMALADINVGLLYILAASSLGVYGIIIAGWASNSKYPFYSALRAAAQMVSYEVSIGFVLISVVLWAGTFNLGHIIDAQRAHIFGFVNGFAFNPLLFPMAVVFLISSMAETARAPFDLTEAESELVAGYQTEYSSMSFALFWLGEYGNVLLMCALNAVLFWGGWLPPVDWAPLYAVPGIVWFFLKIGAMFFIFSWVKATVPRYRYDQLMRLGWKIFLPLSLIWVFVVSGYLMLTRYGPANRLTEWSRYQQGGLAGEVVRTTYYCDPNHPTVDFHSKSAKAGGFRLVRLGVIGSSRSKWTLLLPSTSSFHGQSASYRNGSIGGSEKIRWIDAPEQLGEAFISFSDVVEPKGPSTLWVQFGRDDPERLGIVCGPTSRGNLGKA